MNKNLVIWHINKYCIIAIVFKEVNYCILHYSLDFLTTITIAIFLSTIANALLMNLQLQFLATSR